MRTIHKFEISISADIQSLALPAEHEFLAAEFMLASRSVYVWFEVPADLTVETFEYRFKIFATGDGIPDNFHYLATCVDQYIPESYHLYMDETLD